MEQNELELTRRAAAGDRSALEELLEGVRDQVFNLSLRMLGTIPDAEDATQEILIRTMTKLSGFRGESAFSTWVFRIAVNHLKDDRKRRLAGEGLTFEFYGADIDREVGDMPDFTQGVEKELLAQELKLSCTNVMLQCLDPESRCVYILGTMFRADSRVAGEVLGMTPEAYRQKLSRARKRMGDFLSQYCGHAGTGKCRCEKRLNYAAATHRLDPKNLEYTALRTRTGPIWEVKGAMEELDDISDVFTSLPAYRTPEKARRFLAEFQRMKPLNGWLNQALAGFQMPQRPN